MKTKLQSPLLMAFLFFFPHLASSQFLIDSSYTIGGNSVELFWGGMLTDDGSLVLNGRVHDSSNFTNCSSIDGSYQEWLIKLDEHHEIDFQSCFAHDGEEKLEWMEPDGRGGYVLFGYTNADSNDLSCYHGLQDLWLVHVDSTGNVLEQRCYGGSKYDWPRNFTKSADGGYLVAGASLSQDGDLDSSGYVSTFHEDAWMFKLDSAFNVKWNTIWGGTLNEQIQSVTDHPHGGYLAVATSSSDDGDVGSNYGKDDAWLLRLDDTGRVVWQKHYGGSQVDELTAIAMDGDSIAYLAGVSNSSFCTNGGDDDDIWLLKIDTAGNVLYEECYGGSIWEQLNGLLLTNSHLYAYGRTRSSDGDIDSNYGLSDAFIMAFDKSLVLHWVQNYGGSDHDNLEQLVSGKDNIIYAIGYTQSRDHDITDFHGGDYDAWLIELKETPTGLNAHRIEEPSASTLGDNIPNPFEQSTVIPYEIEDDKKAMLIVTNSMGQTMKTIRLNPDKGRLTLSTESWPAGLYYYSLELSGQVVETKSMTIVK